MLEALIKLNMELLKLITVVSLEVNLYLIYDEYDPNLAFTICSSLRLLMHKDLLYYPCNDSSIIFLLFTVPL